VLGKMSVLFITLSWITWLPGLVLFFVQASLSGWQWLIDNFWIAIALVTSSLLGILVLSLLALALSAWVKWRIVAGAALLGAFFLGAGFAQAINAVLRTQQGYLIDISRLLSIVWHDLFRDSTEPALSVTEAWLGLLALSAFCLYLLMKKVRANEVIR
jgi:ABC-2 type transport system permease protein